MIDLSEYDLTDSAEFRLLVKQARPPASPSPAIVAAIASLAGLIALFLKGR